MSDIVEHRIGNSMSVYSVAEMHAQRSAAYREGFEAGAKAMRGACVDRLRDEENTRGHPAASLSQSQWLHIMHAVENEPIPAPKETNE